MHRDIAAVVELIRSGELSGVVAAAATAAA
jgi:hypothetical protein